MWSKSTQIYYLDHCNLGKEFGLPQEFGMTKHTQSPNQSHCMYENKLTIIIWGVYFELGVISLLSNIGINEFSIWD